jgi:hypothetical protein
MTEITRLAVHLLKLLGLNPTWPLIGAAKSAIQTEAQLFGCTVQQAAGSIGEEAVETRIRGGSVKGFTEWYERRRGRMRRLTNKEQRKAILGGEFVEECPACACGNLHVVRKHNGDLFVGCDCFHTECPCRYSYAVPEV